MPYVIPSFNLLCDVWTYNAAVVAPAVPAFAARILAQPCALVYGRRISTNSPNAAPPVTQSSLIMHLLLPAGADVRGPQDTVGPDWIQVPAGSGRWYRVRGLDDIGKGWPNEHRTAELNSWPGSWVAPYP